MAFEIVKTFVVRSPPDRVWSFLTDPEKVASCLPGAAITGKLDEKTWQGTMTVKVGPVSSSYKGKVAFEKLDTASRTAGKSLVRFFSFNDNKRTSSPCFNASAR